MATKTKTKEKGAIERVVEAAADAAQELGIAATSFKQTLRHVQAARSKAQPATTAVKRMASKAAYATTKTVKAVLPKRRTTKTKAASRRKASHKK